MSSVLVSCRFRRHDSPEASLSLEFPDEHSVVIQQSNKMNQRHSSFHRVFPGATSQEKVFEEVGAPVVQELLNGYNYTILAYGQTGSGKTHTILGSKADSGILPRLIERIFVATSELGESIQVTVSFFEVYQERIGDLLTPSNVNLRIREDKEKGIWIEGATEIAVQDAPTTMKYVQRGIQCRSIGGHLMNAESSRSHCIFVLSVIRPTASGLKQIGKLYVVDLAGSEMVRKTAACGKRLDEAKYINKSLTALGLVINALTDGSSKHVPYRDSKLTRLLQNSLGGNAKTHLVLTCSSSQDNLEETLSTIRFGSRAQHIRNTPHVNAEKNISEYKELVAIMEKKVEALSAHIAQLVEQSKTCKCSIKDQVKPNVPCSSDDTSKQPCCDVCHEHTPLGLILCDGNSGKFFHPECVSVSPINTNRMEFYCPSCQALKDNPQLTDVQIEIANLKQSLHFIKQERDHVEQRAQVDRQVFEFAEKKKSDIHRELETTIAKQEETIQALRHELNQLRSEIESNNLTINTKDRDIDTQRRHFKQQAEQNQAELDIVRRSLESYEREHAKLHDQIAKLQNQLNDADKRSRKDADEIEINRLALLRRDEVAHRNNRLAHAQSFPTLSKPTISPPKPQLRPVTVAEDPRHNLQSRSNLQQWWSGPQDSHANREKGVDLTHNNISEEQSCENVRPFKARLVGLLASLQEETDAFKDLGDKISVEQTRQKTRRTRRTRHILPDLQAPNDFNESVLAPHN